MLPRPWITALLALASLGAARGQAPQAPRLQLLRGDRLALVGGGLAYRMQQDGWLETLLAARFPELELTVRNLGFPADELAVQQRVDGFGTQDEWLARAGTSVVFGFWGFNESFAGPPGLTAFRSDLRAWVEHARGLRPGGGPPLRVVLVTPMAAEDLQRPTLPDARAADARLEPYARAVAEVAREAGVPCVDLFVPTRELFAGREALTIDGVHLNERGGEGVARLVEAALFGAPAAEDSRARLEAIRARVQEKDRLWFDVYQATDGYNVYGGRSSLSYGGVSNFEVLQRELALLEVQADNADRRIHAEARGGPPAEETPARDEPPLLPVATNRPGPRPDGSWDYLSGEAAVARMTVGDGLRVQLFASEERFPELAKPVQMAFDTRGRLWVACWPTYPHWQPKQPRNDKLLVLQDDDGDGRADRCTTFAGDLHNPTGFEHWNGGVLLAAAPDLLFLRDTDGDDVADSREVLLSGLSSGDTHHTANSFVLGPDGALYVQEGIFHQSQLETPWGPVRNHDACVWRFQPRSFRLERYAPFPFLNPHGHVFDRWGQDFLTDGTTNENYVAAPLAVHVSEPRKLPGTAPFFPQRSRPAAATELLTGSHFPPEFLGDLVIANVIGFQGLFRYDLTDDGAGFAAREEQPLLFSSDPNFRPVDVEVGPDGALWFLDWCNALIGHMQHHLRDPSRDHVHGRIYRVVAEGRPLAEPATVAGRPIDELLELLKSADDRLRYRVRIELSGRDGAAVIAAARAWEAALDPADPDVEHHRLEALWCQQQHEALDQELLERLLASPEPHARAAAVRVLRQMRGDVHAPLDLLARAIEDEHPRVRLEAVVALSFFPEPRAAELALRALSAPMDRFLDYALARTMEELSPDLRAALAEGADFAARDPVGFAWALARLDDGKLAGLPPSAALSTERLARPGLPALDYLGAAHDLAERHDSSAAGELLLAIERADLRGDGHADHLLAGLFRALDMLPLDAHATLAAPLRSLSAEGRRSSTRRLATAARVLADGTVDPAWSEASRSPDGLAELLDALSLLTDAALREQAFRRVAKLLDQPASAAVAAGGVSGRYVRVELPGPARTLTLAEVAVSSHGENVAPEGRATQSTDAWGGVASRAIDGNTSGAFGDGGQSHTVEDQPDPWWELDLGRDRSLDAITVWNRAEEGGRWVSRLDGWVVRVLDGGRRTVFEQRGERAPAESLTLELAGPELRVRRAAVRALGELASSGEQADAVVAALLARFDEPALRPVITATLAGLRASELSADSIGAQAVLLESEFADFTPERAASDDGRMLLALADVVATQLAEPDAPRAAALRALRRRYGPQVIVIRPVPDSLQFDRREITVVAGRPVELVFENVDIMPHNLVLAGPGALARVGLAGEAMAAQPDAWARGFVPDLPEVLAATRLLQPGERQTLRFDAPADPQEQPYLCTFPGHWLRMNGVLRVVAEADAVFAEPLALPAPAAPARAFVRSWTPEDFRAGLAESAAADPAHGREVLDAAGCLKCHAVDGAGGRTGPELRDVAARWDRADLLEQILQPSRNIAEGYASELFFLRGGDVVAGRVVGEDVDGVDVLDDPYGEAPRRVLRSSIEERRPSEVSIMPEGLLTTFTREEIVSLVGYLASLRQEEAGGR